MFVLAVIPARGGSRGLPRKNLRWAAGRPLLAYTLDYLREETLVGDVVLSTEDSEIAALGESLGVRVIWRPAELAADDIVSTEAVRHAVLEYERLLAQRVDIAVELYITCPIRPKGLVNRAVTQLLETGATGAMSVARVGIRHPNNMLKLDGGGFLSHPFGYPKTTRQINDPLYYLSGAAFLARRDVLVKSKLDRQHPDGNYLFGDRLIGIEHAAGEVIDIDDEIDFQFVEFLLSRRQSSTS